MPTWTFEQKKNAIDESPLAFTNNVKSGSLLLCMAGRSGDLWTGSEVPTDTRSNTWTRIDRARNATDNYFGIWWYAISNGAGADTVTLPAGAGSFRASFIAEYSVDAGTISLDQHFGRVQTGTGTGVNATTSTAVTTTANEELVVSVVWTSDGTTSGWTPGTTISYVERDDITSSDNATNHAAFEDAKQTSAGSVAGTWTAPANANVVVFVATFKTSAPPVRQSRPMRSRGISW